MAIKTSKNTVAIKYFLIGHRGVGKTTLLEDFKLKSKDYLCFDLDLEIEKRNNIKIKDMFAKGLVKEFRNLELKTLTEINSEFDRRYKSNSKNKLMVALGAGFELSRFKFPKTSMVLWLRRSTDSIGRIFSDRPALTMLKNPLDEWSNIFSAREIAYQKYSTSQVYIPEYFDKKFNALYEYLNFKAPLNGFVTLISKENEQLLSHIDCSIELRSDLLHEKEILKIIKNKSMSKKIIAFRNTNSSLFSKVLNLKNNDNEISNKSSKDSSLKLSLTSNTKSSVNSSVDSSSVFEDKILIDWDMTLGLPSKIMAQGIDIYSSHEDQPILQILMFEDHLKNVLDVKKNIHYKICPTVDSHEAAIALDLELDMILDRGSYSFLPRSKAKTGAILKDVSQPESLDLSYFRQLKSYTQKIGFYRFGEGSSLDQPLWWQWPQKTPKGFYGIYGQNIKHSYTPSFHLDFFKKKNLWPISIDSFPGLLKYKNYFKENKLKVLAVTSPYKAEIFKLTDFKLSDFKSDIQLDRNLSFEKTSSLNSEFKSANTLILNSKILSFNTDFIGLSQFLKKHLDPSIQTVVWGGGALLDQLQRLVPKALFYSAQVGELRSKEKNISKNNLVEKAKPIQLIWASGEKGLLPDNLKVDFKISKIIDLDYRDNSRAKLYSYLNNIDYVSGFEFFVLQAKAQQKIWDNYEF